MGMPEYNDGSLGDVKEIKDLRDAFKEATNPNVARMHIAEKVADLEKAKVYFFSFNQPHFLTSL